VPLRFALQIVERRSPRVECDGTLNPEEVVRLLFCLLHTAYSILRTAYYVLTPAFPISPAFPATPALLAFFLTIWYHEVRILLYRGDTTMGNHVNGTGDDRFMIIAPSGKRYMAGRAVQYTGRTGYHADDGGGGRGVRSPFAD
jgi:hypothetical protein